MTMTVLIIITGLFFIILSHFQGFVIGYRKAAQEANAIISTQTLDVVILSQMHALRYSSQQNTDDPFSYVVHENNFFKVYSNKVEQATEQQYKEDTERIATLN